VIWTNSPFGAVDDEEVAVLVEVPEQLAPVLLEQDALGDAVVVPHVVRGALVVPADLAGCRRRRR
jgi:hypothetical protein